MIAIEQIRAGRAMLNWTQRELAKAAGISLRNLNNIEAGLGTPRLETLQTIYRALDKGGIEFMDNGAVRMRREIFEMEKHEGVGAIQNILYDVIEGFRQGHNEFLLCNSNEKNWVENTPDDLAEDYYRTLERAGARERCLIVHGDRNFLGFPSGYRWLAREYFSEVPYAVYGFTVMLIVWLPVVRIAVIRNAAIADSFRRHFEFAWKHADIPPFARLAKQYPNLDKPRIWLSEKEIARLEQTQD